MLQETPNVFLGLTTISAIPGNFQDITNHIPYLYYMVQDIF